MPVPNTNTFTLSDVCNELGLTGGDRNLVQCFAVAVSGSFDPAYEGSKDRLLNFRNYGAASNVLTISPTTRNSPNGGESFVLTITSNTSWQITSSQAWATSSIASGSGNATPTITVDPNFGGGRIGLIQVQTTSGSPSITRTLTINQA